MCREVKANPAFVDEVGQNEEAVTKQMQAITKGVNGIVEKAQQVGHLCRQSKHNNQPVFHRLTVCFNALAAAHLL